MSINQAITKAIEENLPSAVAGELAQYIKTSEDTKKALDRLKEDYEAIQSTNDTLRKEITAFKDQQIKYVDFLTREKAVIIAENNLKVVIAEHKSIEAEKRADAIYKLAETAFKNRAITRMVQTSIPVHVPYNTPGFFQHQNGQETHTETETDSN